MGKMLSPKLRELSGPETEEGQELAYWCPACGTRHYVSTTKPNHCNAIWFFNGDAESPTFHPSVNVNHGECHHWVINGKIRYELDSKHALAGMTVDLPPLQGY